LATVRSRLSTCAYGNLKLANLVCEAYLKWVGQPEYLVFAKHNGVEVAGFQLVKAAKRGNDVYNWRVWNRFQRSVGQVGELEFFNHKDRGVHHTQLLFITLTYREEGRSLEELWTSIGKDYNRFISALRKRYGRVEVVRCWEATRRGLPHIHLIALFEGHHFTVFKHRGKWRVRGKRDLESLWPHGFMDVVGLSALSSGVGYLGKYLFKQYSKAQVNPYNDKQVRSLALCWFFRRRSFSISRGFSSCDLIKTSVTQTVLGGEPLGSDGVVQTPEFEYRLIGFWRGRVYVDGLHRWRVFIPLECGFSLGGGMGWMSRVVDLVWDGGGFDVSGEPYGGFTEFLFDWGWLTPQPLDDDGGGVEASG